MDVDGTKSRMSRKINLKEYVGSNNSNNLNFVHQNPMARLNYSIHVKLEGSSSNNLDKIGKNPSPNKKIQFEQDYLSSNGSNKDEG